MNKNQLRKLRTTFRKRMKERDFCIGEEQVEELFRELLGEPKPVEPEYVPTGRPISAQEIADGFAEVFTREKIDQIFNRSDSFFKILKK